MSGGRLRHGRAGVGLWLAALLAAPSIVVAAPRVTSPVPAAPDPIAAAPAGTSSWVVALRPGKDPDQLAQGLARGAGGKVGHVFNHALHGFVFKASAKAAEALRRNPDVRSIAADGPIHVTADTIGTGVSRIRANHSTPPSAYASGFTGAGVRVAILDTGIDLTHPDLVPNLDTSLGANCITTGPPQDGHGHGTHVAGIVAAADNGLGMVGVAPHARLVPFKVLDDTGQGEWSNLICAIDIITGYATDSDPSNDIQVANMSLGDVGGIGTCTDGFVREAICTSVAAGVTYVAAAGNSTTDAGTFIPAAMPEVISVSALTDLDGEPGGLGGCWLFFLYCDDTLAEYSNYGPSVDLTAPGTQITSDWTGGTYATEMGTSMAAPHVTGAAALLLSAFPGLTPAEVIDQLRTTGECPNGQLADADGTGSCVGKGQWGNDPDGIAEPLVNALNAVSGGIPGDRRPTVHVTSPTAGATVSGVVNVTASATDDNGVTKVDFLVNGIQAATDANGADGWSFSWNTAGLDPGVDTITAKATDTASQTSTSSVTVQVGTNVQGSWVGQFGHDGYVLAGWNGGLTDVAALPAGVSYAIDQGARYVWASPTTDVRALTSPDQTERRSTTWYDKSSLRLHLTFANAYAGTIHLYAVDWDAYGGDRLQNVTIDDGHGPRTVQLSVSFFNGAWIHAPINVVAGGTVTIHADWTGGETAVLSGLFLGGVGAPPPPPPPPPSLTVDQPGVQGSWTASYGIQGYVLANWDGAGTDLTNLPAGVTSTLEKGGRATWVASTTDVRALTNPTGTSRQSRTWYDAQQMRVRLSFANAYSGTLHLYGVDWDSYQGNRYETITVDDGQGPRQAQLSTSFYNGAWIHAPVTVPAGGSVVITVDKTGGNSAVLAGLFLGSPGPPIIPLPYETPGVQGSWVGHYGAAGYVLANWNGANTDLTSLPAGVTSTLEKGGRATWAATTTDVRGLTDPTGTSRQSRTWYDANQMRVRVSFANGFTGTLHLYAVDWDSFEGNRYEYVTVDDGRGPQVASITTSFYPGAWIHAPIVVQPGGSVVITVDRIAGNSAVLAGLFLDGQSGPPSSPPGAPTGLGAIRGNSQVTLSWTAPVSDGGSAITGYRIYRGTISGGESFLTTVATPGYVDANLANGTTYWYQVSAVNAIGESQRTAEAAATPATVPGGPTGLAATAGNGQVSLSWSAPVSNGGSAVTGYKVYRGMASAAETLLATVGNVTSFTDSGLTNGTTYWYQVSAMNAVGEGARSGETSTTPAAVPGAPGGLTATRGNGQIALGWSAAAPNGNAVTAYNVYRGTASGAEVLLTTLGNATTFTDAGLTNGTTYWYQVSAVNGVGEGPRSGEVSGTPATTPGAPTALTATAGNTQVSLSWTAPVNTDGAAISGYNLYRGTASGGETFLTTLGNVTSFTDTGLTNGTTYWYEVSAINAVGEGGRSTETSATPVTPAGVPGAPNLTATRGDAQVVLTWTAAASNGSAVTNYRIYRSTSSGTEALLTTVGNVLTFTDTGRTNGTTYWYQVSAINAVGEGARSTERSATPATTPGAPRNVSAKSANPSGVSLNWAAPTSTGGSPITGYQVYRGTTSGGESLLTTLGVVTTFKDTATTSGTRYFYRIAAVNAVGAGPQSSEVNARAR